MPKKNSLKEVIFADAWHHLDSGRKVLRTMVAYHNGYHSEGEEVRPNDPFHATLRLMYLERGRSAARFWWKDVDTGTMYPMFGQGIVEMLSNVTLVHGFVEGDWIAVKRGANYGIERYEA